MNGAERRKFVQDHRTCIYGYERQSEAPSMSVVYYGMDGDDILMLTMEERAKAKALIRNPQVSLCILDEQWPLTYLLVYGRGKIERNEEEIVDLAMKIRETMAGVPTPASMREMVRETMRREKRVLMRITPTSTFETPPRQVTAEMQDADSPGEVTHWVSELMPWDAD